MYRVLWNGAIVEDRAVTPAALQALVADLRAALADALLTKDIWRDRALIAEARTRALEDTVGVLLEVTR